MHGIGKGANLASLILEGEVVFVFVFWYCLLFLEEEKRSSSVKKGEPLDWSHARAVGKPRPGGDRVADDVLSVRRFFFTGVVSSTYEAVRFDVRRDEARNERETHPRTGRLF
jgi:hypothetical protein